MSCNQNGFSVNQWICYLNSEIIELGEVISNLPEGPKGDKGDPGVQGVQGPQGVQGIQGNMGVVGPQGVQGPQGLVGPKGETGARGEQGCPGVPGQPGEQGCPGEQGAQGEAGAQGPQGPQGPQGLEGDTGPQGPQGVQGPKGDKGDKGDKGVCSCCFKEGNAFFYSSVRYTSDDPQQWKPLPIEGITRISGTGIVRDNAKSCFYFSEVGTYKIEFNATSLKDEISLSLGTIGGSMWNGTISHSKGGEANNASGTAILNIGADALMKDSHTVGIVSANRAPLDLPALTVSLTIIRLSANCEGPSTKAKLMI